VTTYLDDDVSDHLLIRMLRAAGHTVIVPGEAGTAGQADPRHLLDALRRAAAIVTRNVEDFENLHFLVVGSGGAHAGVFLIHSEATKKRNMKRHEIVAALTKYEAAGLDPSSQLINLNHWR
jgi:Domain of unknown function (DUF5615)